MDVRVAGIVYPGRQVNKTVMHIEVQGQCEDGGEIGLHGLLWALATCRLS